MVKRTPKTPITTTENHCFDCMVGVFGWLCGCFEGTSMGIAMICAEKKQDTDFINDVGIFVHTMESGYHIGKTDTVYVGKYI
jgi:hypothetical protein